MSAAAQGAARPGASWPHGEAGMARRIREHDWAATPLGPIGGWSGRLRLMVEQMLATPLVSALVCGTELVLLYNDAAARLYGPHHPGALGRPLPRSFPDGWATVAPFYARAFAGEGVRVASQPLDTRGEGDPEADVFDAVLVPVREEDGRVAYVYMTGSEVGARARAETALRQSEERLRRVLETETVGVVFLDRAGVVVDANDAFLRMTGYTRADVGSGGLTWGSILPAGSGAEGERRTASLAARGRFGPCEREYARKDGARRWMLFTGRDLGDGTTSAFCIDIHDRRMAEEALRESGRHHRTLAQAAERRAAELRAVLESMGDAVYIGGIDGITLANQIALDQLGFASREELNRHVGVLAQEIQTRDAVTGAAIPVEEQAFARALRGERVVQDVRVRHRLSGEERIVRCSASPVVLDGTVIAAVAVNTDVTQHRAAEAALRVSEARQAFLLALGDALRTLADPAAILAEACRMLAEQLDTDRAYFVETDEAAGVARVERDYVRGDARSLAGDHRIADFAWSIAILRRGECQVVGDTQSSPLVPPADRPACAALRVRACMGAPLIKAGRLVGALCVTDSRPRDWTEEELGLLREAGERIWAAVERARAEAALRASEGRHAYLLELSDALRALGDPVEIQHRATALLGRHLGASRVVFAEVVVEGGEEYVVVAREHRAPGAASFVGRHAAARFGPDLHALRAGRAVAVADVEADHPDGGAQAVWRALGVRARLAVPLVKEGRLVAGLGVHHAAPRAWTPEEIALVTETAERTWAAVGRARAEAALRESEERFRNLADNAPVMVWVTDPAGACTYLGRSWYAFTGQTEDTGLGFGWLAAVHPEDRERARQTFIDANASRQPFRLDYRLRRADGACRWAIDAAAPRFGADGTFLGYVGSVVDITERKEIEEALRRANETLDARVQERTAELMAAEESLRQAQKMEAVGQLTGGIAHDFNNMLQGVVGGLAMARRQIGRGEGEGALRYLDAAYGAAERAAGLTRRLLAFARRQQLQPRPVDAEGLIAGMVELIRRTVGPGIEVELRLGEAARMVLSDPNELESAVLNLCINARDAMPGGGRLTIGTDELYLGAAEARSSEVAPGPYAEISIRDTGTGMPPRVLERAFEPFFTTKPQGQGTGLGLSQVWGFARQSDGLVRIESAPGRGTAVRLLLPLRPGMVADAAPDPAPGTPDQVGGTILLVDDEDVVRGPAADRLRELGLAVLEARDGPEALRVLASSPRPDLLVTDVGLPGGMNGRQVAEAVRAHLPNLPVLFVTGYAGTALPPDIEVIGKPFTLDALAGRVQAILLQHARDVARHLASGA